MAITSKPTAEPTYAAATATTSAASSPPKILLSASARKEEEEVALANYPPWLFCSLLLSFELGSVTTHSSALNKAEIAISFEPFLLSSGSAKSGNLVMCVCWLRAQKKVLYWLRKDNVS